MHTTVRLDSLPEAVRAEALRRGIRRGVRVEIEVIDLNRLLRGSAEPSTFNFQLSTFPPPWPAWARGLETQKIAGELGIGDTAERLFGKIGGTQFKKLTAKLGINCGCGTRKDNWNRKYPY